MSSYTNKKPKVRKRWIILGLMISVALAAIDVTIVSTALPTIVAQLSGVELYSWLVSVYLLTSTTTVPLYGQLADNFGRKPILLFGIVLFTLSSLACAQAGTTTQLIIYRAIQGMGAGAILPMTMTIIGDIFSIEERAKYQGLFSSVWGVSSIVGPGLGAFILSVWSWHGIFLINLPVGITALFLIIKFYHEETESSHRSVDIGGAILLTGGVGSFLLAIERARSGAPWEQSLYLVSVLSLVVLFFVEKKAKSPILPLSLIRKRIIGSSYLVTLLVGVLQFGLTAYIPLFVQGALGGTPISVGITMAPMAIGWPLGSVLSGKLILRMGYKQVLSTGMVIGILSSIALLMLSSTTPLALVVGLVAMSGFSLGLVSTPLIIAVQNAVEWKQRGITTALAQFSRTIGGVVGVAVMGGLFNSNIARLMKESQPLSVYSSETLMKDILDPAARGGYPEIVLTTVQTSIADALHSTYLLPLGATALGFLILLVFFPRGSAEQNKFNTGTQ